MNYKNTEIEDEITDADERKVLALLSDLKRIDAPADFDFRLKARIARRKPDDARAPQFLPQFLRYALPFGLVILVAAFVVFNGVYFADERAVAPIAESQNAPPKNRADESGAAEIARNEDETILSAPTETARVSDAADAKNKDSWTIAKPSAVRVEAGRKPKTKIAGEDLSGSREAALTQETRIITPPGINPNRTAAVSPNAENGKSLTVKEVLSQLGVEAGYERESWRVKSVVKNSLAERSGVRPGDSVEAIDGERLTDKPLKRQSIDGKNLTVSRGAEKIEISLTNKLN